MTFQEYSACQNALFGGKGARIALWTVLTIGAACLASSAAMTWGTPASILAGLALAAFGFIFLWGGRARATRFRQAYLRQKESYSSYVFTTERILVSSRNGQSSLMWSAVTRALETKTLYVLAGGNWCLCIPKRAIPPDDLAEFIQLLRTHCGLATLSRAARPSPAA
jgi:hypothetical protein